MSTAAEEKEIKELLVLLKNTDKSTLDLNNAHMEKLVDELDQLDNFNNFDDDPETVTKIMKICKEIKMYLQK